ncbi:MULTISPECIES: hypothetical protein [unclassified Streptomyces]|uniref:hypothetical protein n=1 Tax=Streptomycetaceae TaxID=2062 RepID=UPI002E77BDCC|nr:MULTISPECIES: hypothetical protein [unclassified Streptomyces]MED7948034.1 hypothetical protein [Streptomyces sp. BE303]MEE1822854.1 hypothetical protein [Streptomyces sp. BE20]
MLSKRLAGTAAICLLLAAGATACGDTQSKAGAAPKLDTEKLSAQEIEQATKDALSAATSVKITGDIAMDEGKMTIDLALDTKSQCTGTMSMPGMGKFEIISDGKQSYVKPDKEFWTAIAGKEGAKAAELFKGRYLSGLQDSEMKDLTSVCNLKDFTAKIVSDDSGKSEATKGGAATVNGQKAFSLKVKDRKGEESTIHVATEGKFYPLRVEKKSGTEGGQIDFTDYDKPLTIQAPPADNVIDFAKLQDQLKSA